MWTPATGNCSLCVHSVLTEMEVKVHGLKELQKRLVEIGSVAGTKSMRSAMFTATKPIMEQAKANTARFTRSGALRESISRTFGVKVSGGFVFGSDTAGSRFSILVGPKLRNRTAIALYNLVYKKKRPIRGIFYGHLLEFGHRIGTRKTGYLSRAKTLAGINRASRRGRSQGSGRVEPRPFLLPALLSRSAECTRLLAEALKKRIDTAAKKR